RMTLTSEACPSAKAIPDDVVKKVEQLDGVRACRVEVVWEPRWSPERISPEGKRTLGLDEDE
ncbi:MAG: metal-sulfur cluster assembly factor, partial [Planctomycetota bacterium JB042]